MRKAGEYSSNPRTTAGGLTDLTKQPGWRGALPLSPAALMAACIAVYVAAGLSSCHSGMSRPQRPGDPWAFRSVLDQRPRMLTLALDSDCYMAYDLAACEAYRVWKGGVSLQGAAYTSRK